MHDEQSITGIFSKYYEGNQIKDDDIGRTHRTHGRLGMHQKFYAENMKERNH
jgi:hypothetical protein